MLKVLVVDDSKVMRRMVVRCLELSGLEVSEVQEAESGSEALAVLQRMWIDVVLCDVHMPKMSGVELAQRMSEDRLTADVPVVMVLSDCDQAQMDELQRLGVRGYVVMPFQPEALARTVQRVLGLPGGIRERRKRRRARPAVLRRVGRLLLRRRGVPHWIAHGVLRAAPSLSER